MTHELVYTSAPRGVRAGATGYCTVAHTAGLPADLRDQLEGLSRYRHRTIGDDPSRSGNPVAYAHTILTVGYQTYHVLSRVADTGLDHTGRSNYLAHHIAFGPEHLPTSGPAWLCGQPKVFETGWDGPPEVLAAPRGLPTGTATTRKCKRWERAAGDAGWAGMLAAATHPGEPAYLLYEPGEDVLGLISEAMALLPPAERWKVTFNTYFTGATAGVDCQWRCVPADSPEAREAVSARRGVILRVDRPMAGEPTGPLVDAARTGLQASPTRSPVSAAATREPLPAPVARDSSRPRKPRAVVSPIEEEPAFPETEDRAEKPRPRPVAPPPPPPPAGSGIRPLLLGIVLGGMLFLVCGSVIELAAGRSLLRFVSVQGRDELDAISKAKLLADDLEAAKRETAVAMEAKEAKVAELGRVNKELEGAKSEAKGLDRKWKDALKDKEAAEEDLRKAQAARDKPRDGNGAKELAAEKEKLEKELSRITKERDALASPPVVVGLVPPSRPGKKSEPWELFRVAPSGEKTQKIDVLGLPEGVKPSRKVPGKVSWAEKGDKFTAELAVDHGVVTVLSEHLDQHPLLGLAIIRLTTGDERHAIYRQLFRVKEHRTVEVKLARDPTVSGTKGSVNTADLVDQSIKTEFQWWIKGGGAIAFGRTATVSVGGREYPLEPEGAAPAPTVLKYRPQPDEKAPTIILQIGKDGVISVEVDSAEARCEVRSLEVVRPVTGLPGYMQELLRIR